MKIVKFLIVACLITGLSIPGYAEQAKKTATVMELEGSCQVKAPEADWTNAEVGMVLSEGAEIKTGANSLAVLNLEYGEESAMVELKENGDMKLASLFADKEAGAQSTLLDLALGEILITSKKLRSEKSKFEVKTPTSIVGVRGTTFSVSVEQEQ